MSHRGESDPLIRYTTTLTRDDATICVAALKLRGPLLVRVLPTNVLYEIVDRIFEALDFSVPVEQVNEMIGDDE